ncbi:MAG: NAD(P)/FAD-dependent oxidoreductase [Alphaproteobacteria bacterium]|nr:NAD(P)/FAD-dependent oxidoreductase [Alphaproteobacteria bacterium]
MTENPSHIVIVGGGAGGLVLATVLGRKLGKSGKARVTLIDHALTHVWKPLLHEIAAGTLNSDSDSVNYLGHAKAHGFRFVQGEMDGLDRDAKTIWLAPMIDEEGEEIVPRRPFAYDKLVLAVGSTTNDFGVEGVKEHCVFLDDHHQADRLQQRLLRDFLRAQVQEKPLTPGQLRIAIVGAGATGVELAAELHRAARGFVAYGLDRIDAEKGFSITLIEAAPKVLPALSPKLQDATEMQLAKLGIEVLAGEQVVKATADQLITKSGKVIDAAIKVWCAGVRGPAFFETLGELQQNRSYQLEIDETLCIKGEQDIYAIGDCAACLLPGQEKPVPPRAQAAYQQAHTLAATLANEGAARRFVYKDYGSLISLSYSAVGNLMGNLFGTVMIEGLLARLTYLSLYRKHQLSLHGLRWVIMNVVARLFMRGTQPELKLH